MGNGDSFPMTGYPMTQLTKCAHLFSSADRGGRGKKNKDHKDPFQSFSGRSMISAHYIVGTNRSA